MIRSFSILALLFAGCSFAPVEPTPEPVPIAPRPVKPTPAARVPLLLFTQPGCAPCAALKRNLADAALADTMRHFDLIEVTPPDKRFREYKVNGTPALFAVTPNGAQRWPGGGTLGQLAAWLGKWERDDAGSIEAITEGGPVGPGGIEVATDLPVVLRAKNVGGRDGAGLCVFTSIMHAARWANELKLWDFQKQMRAEPGGGYPQKVDAMIKKYGKGAQYIQFEGQDPAILELALKTCRMPCVTYNGHDCHYRGTIAHMVNLVYLDSSSACILDNNFIGENQLVWMSRQEFLERWTGGRSGWAVVLLSPRPPNPPHN